MAWISDGMFTSEVNSLAFVIVLVYLAINLLALGVFAFDKKRAIDSGYRVPEKTLLSLSAIGPFGAVAGMKTFRHKTRKPLFKLVYVFAIIHVIVLVYIAFTI